MSESAKIPEVIIDEETGDRIVLVEGRNEVHTRKVIRLNIAEFLKCEFPPREQVLAPWLPTQGLAQMYSKRGVGKTQLALNIAVAVASGGTFLNWQAPNARKVLYLDGEMPGSVIQERIAAIVSGLPEDFDQNNFMIVNPDLQQYGMPDLSSIEGQEDLKPFTAEADLIIVDNISTLCRASAENKADDWIVVQEWALRMRSEGRSVLFIHHAGKGGAQRGTSKREDVLDTVIALRHPVDYTQDKGAEFEIHFEKSRGFTGDDAKPILVSLVVVNGEQFWSVTSLEKKTYDLVIELRSEGLTPKEIADELGVNKSTVSRNLRRAREEGRVGD